MRYTYKGYISFVFNGPRGKQFNVFKVEDVVHIRTVSVGSEYKNNLNHIINRIKEAVNDIIREREDVLIEDNQKNSNNDSLIL